MKKPKKTKSLNIKISEQDKEFLSKNKLSPSKLFNQILLMVKSIGGKDATLPDFRDAKGNRGAEKEDLD